MRKILKCLVILLLGFAAGLATAAPVTVQTYAVIVGSYSSQEPAREQVQRLEGYYGKRAEIAALQERNGFKYEAVRSGDYFTARIAPIAGREAMQTMLEESRKAFKGAYVVKLGKREVPAEQLAVSAGQSEVLAPEPAAAAEAAPEPVTAEPLQEPVPAAEAETADETPAEVKPAPVQPEAVPEPSAAPAERVEPQKEVTPSAASAAAALPAAPAEAADLSGLLQDERVLYGAAAVVVVLLLLLLLRPKKEKPPKGGEERVEAAVSEEAPESAEVLEKEPEAAMETEPIREAVELPEEEAEIAVEAEKTVPEEVFEAPVPPRVEEILPEAEVSPRKKRSYKHGGASIGKEDFKIFSGARLLVAEDNMINQKVITSLLADTGIEITLANDGQEALNVLEKDRGFDMVLMDAHMPIMDGFEATEAIRANRDYEAIPVVALSGDTGVDDIRKMEEAGMEAQLEKPLRLDALYEVMYNYARILPGEEEAEEEAVELLPDTPELHAEKGLDVSMGDEGLYREILEEFSRMYGSSDETLQGFMVRGALEEAEAMLLDVYGIAANIGADQLSETAEELREALLAGKEVQYDELLARYREHLEAVLADIKKV
jgi:CheY-like chemotaxis protein